MPNMTSECPICGKQGLVNRVTVVLPHQHCKTAGAYKQYYFYCSDPDCRTPKGNHPRWRDDVVHQRLFDYCAFGGANQHNTTEDAISSQKEHNPETQLPLFEQTG